MKVLNSLKAVLKIYINFASLALVILWLEQGGFMEAVWVTEFVIISQD